MSSTYSILKFELPGNGEQSGTWGTTTNTNIGTAIEQAIVGMATLEAADFTANVATLTLANTNAAQDARALCLNIASGAVSAAGTVNVPAIEKPYIVINGSSFTVTVKVSGQTGVAVPAGKRTVVYNNGTDVGSQINWLAALDLAGNASIGGTLGVTGAVTLSGGTANGVPYLNASKVLTTGSALTFDGTNLSLLPSGYSSFGASNSEQMRLTSTGLGIGTSSPVSKLDISGGSSTGGLTVSGSINTVRASSTVIDTGDGSRFLALGPNTSTAATMKFIVASSDASIYTTAATIDSSGNLGLGVTPSAWASGWTALQVKGASLWSDGNTRSFLTTNLYFDGSSRRYISTNPAFQYTQDVNGHQWYTAPSGTAGNAISFTQAMTLDASGNLLVGTTTPLGDGLSIRPFASAGGTTQINLNRASTTTTGYPIVFQNGGADVGFISYSNTTVTYNTGSDYRLKTITGPITTSGAYIDSLNPVEGTWNADGSTFVGLIAHEVQEASRTPVATGTKDGEQMQGMDYSSAEIIANLIAEVKSLRQRLAAAGI